MQQSLAILPVDEAAGSDVSSTTSQGNPDVHVSDGSASWRELPRADASPGTANSCCACECVHPRAECVTSSVPGGEGTLRRRTAWIRPGFAGVQRNVEDKRQVCADANQLGRPWYSMPIVTCFGGRDRRRTVPSPDRGTPSQVSRRIKDARKDKEDHMTISCSCL